MPLPPKMLGFTKTSTFSSFSPVKGDYKVRIKGIILQVLSKGGDTAPRQHPVPWRDTLGLVDKNVQ